MTAIAGAAAPLVLATGVVLVVVCVVGMIRAGDAFARLHFPGAAVLAGPPAAAIAVCLAEGLSATAARAWMIFAVLLLTNGVLAHATARAEWLRQQFPVDDEEEPDDEDP